MLTKTEHQQRVELLMRKANQSVPPIVTPPTPEVAVLRARLILEEALETIEALGVSIYIDSYIQEDDDRGVLSEVSSDGNMILLDRRVPTARLSFEATGVPDLVGIADGCADVSVVTTGTLSACGIPDSALLRLVDENNLAKFGPGHSFDEYGKLIKPPGHQPPAIDQLLAALDQETRV